MRRLIWSIDAIDDLRAIRRYIAESNPKAAVRVAVSLVQAADSVAIFADRGRPVRPGLRELTVVPPYLIQYAILPYEVRILAIRHSARQPER